MPVVYDQEPATGGRIVYDSTATGTWADYDPVATAKEIAAQEEKLARIRARENLPEFRVRVADTYPVPFFGDVPLPKAIAGKDLFTIPEPIVAFGSEAVKSFPSMAAGAAAASAAMPAATRVGGALSSIPTPATRVAGAAARLGIPLVAGAAGAMGLRTAQDVALPEILPESLADLYQQSAVAADLNPVAAMLGQFAGSAGVYRPGLPIGTAVAARRTLPVITGAIGGGIEGAQQIATGEFDPLKLGIAVLGSAALNKETGLSRKIAPHLVAATPKSSPPIAREIEDISEKLRKFIDKPKSSQILAEPSAKGASVANIATEVATQTTGSPFALQSKLNEGVAAVKQPEAAIPPNQADAISAFGGAPFKSAEESAAVFTQAAARDAAKERRIQSLVDQLSGGDDVTRQTILGRRGNLSEDDFISALEGALDFQRRPQAQPDILAAEVAREAERRAATPLTGEVVESAGAIVPEELGLVSDVRLPEGAPGSGLLGDIRARNVGRAMAEAGGELASAVPAADPRAAYIRTALESPGIDFQYSVFRPGEGYPSAVQVDIISPQGESLGSTNVRELGQHGVKVPEVPDWVPQGRYMRDELDALIRQGDPNAIQIESPATLPVREQPEGGARIRLEDADLQQAPRNDLRQRPLQEPRTEVEQLLAAAPDAPAATPRSAEATALASRMRQQRGAINPNILSPIVGAGGGAAYGGTQGETVEERVRNAALYGSLGLGAGSLAGAVGAKAFSRPIRNYQSPELKKVAQMLTPKETKPSLFQKLSDGYGNFRYRYNTQFAPLGEAQRALWKLSGRMFSPGRYYDLERSFERLAGAPVQAEGEVELLQRVIDKLPRDDVPHLDSYLVLARIEDRLIKTGEDNIRLSDAVAKAQAELAAATAANQANPGVRNSAAVIAKREALSSATKKLKEEYDRKRVGDWSIAEAQRGLSKLEQEIGPDAFARIKQAAREHQAIARRALQIQVDSGRMPQELMDRVIESNDFYAPFKVLKHYEADDPFVKGAGSGRVPTMESLVKKITGIDDVDVRIDSPTNVTAEQVYKGYILAQKNRKMRELATLARIDPEGTYVRHLGADEKPRIGYEKVNYLVNGQPKSLEVDKKIAAALNGADANETDILLRSLGRASALFKFGATGASIPFNLSNAFVFDPLRLSIISRYGFKSPKDFLWTLYEWPKAMFSSAKGNLGAAVGVPPGELYDQWIRSGAANSTLARQMVPEAFTARLPKEAKLGETLVTNNFGLGAPLKLAALLSNTLEETTKIWGLQRAMRIERLDSLPPAERARKWAEIVTEVRNYAGSPDFMRKGVSMRPLNILMPFLNPRWQGATNDFARLNPFRRGNAKDAGAAWTRMTALLGIPTAGLMVYNLSSPENEKDYKLIPQDERDRYFHIPLYRDAEGKPTILQTENGGYYFNNRDGAALRGYYRIPKREFTGLAANTIEDFIVYAKDTDEGSFKQLAANFGEGFLETMSPVSIRGDTLGERAMSAASGVNPALRVPVEVGLNTSLYTGRNIVPESRMAASPHLQFSPTTPEFYKDTAAALPAWAPDTLRSPGKLQYITEGLTGGFSRQFASPKLSPGNPAGESSPLLNRFFRSERVESKALLDAAKEAERGRADQRIQEQDLGDTIVNEMTAAPDAARQTFLRYKDQGVINERVEGYIRDGLTDAARGLTYEDRVIKRSFAISGGFRAKHYAQKLASMTPDERIAYIRDQARKGLLSEEVAAQLAVEMGLQASNPSP